MYTGFRTDRDHDPNTLYLQPYQQIIREFIRLSWFRDAFPEVYNKALESKTAELSMEDRPDGPYNALEASHLITYCGFPKKLGERQPVTL